MLLVLAGVIHVVGIQLTRAGRERGITYDLIYLPGVLGQRVPEKDFGILQPIDRHEITANKKRNLLPVTLFSSMSFSFIYKEFLSRKSLFLFYVLQPTCYNTRLWPFEVEISTLLTEEHIFIGSVKS